MEGVLINFCFPSIHIITQTFINESTYFFLDCSAAANALHATNNFQIIPDFSLKDSMDQTVLGLALWTGTQCCTSIKKL